MKETVGKKQKLFKKCYDKICCFFSIDQMTWMAMVILILLLLPVIYLSFVNCATGDDYGYAVYTREAWISSHSLLEIWKAIVRTIKQYYYGWQGTWFSIFVFTLQPEVFHPKAYVITVFLMLFMWIGSTGLLFKEILYKRLRLNRKSVWLITILFFVFCMEFIPSTKSAIFWFNGTAHYMLPFSMCQLLVVCLLKYEESYRNCYFLGITILMTLLGGSNYQVALFALIVAFYVGGFSYLQKRVCKIFTLFIPIILEMVGLIISVKAPGNKMRGGVDFGFSVDAVLKTIGASFGQGMVQVWEYVKEKPLIFIGLLLIFLVLLDAFLKRREEISIRYSGLLALLMWCLYSAMQAPAIYAGVDVSGGVYNMNYQVFFLVVGAFLVLLAEKITARLRRITHTSEGEENRIDVEQFHGRIFLPGIFLCLLLMIIFKGELKESTSYISFEYIVSGQASDYKEQMDLQTSLLLNSDTENVILPFINDVQGPLMHMPVTADEDAWTNRVTAGFYGKESVIAIPREEWIEEYGEYK